MKFTDKERRVYGPYWDGQEQVLGDPLRIYRTLMYLTDGRLNDLLIDSHAKTPAEVGDDGKTLQAEAPNYRVQHPAVTKLLAATTEAMSLHRMTPSDAAGLTEAEVLERLDEFLEWLEKNV